LQAIDSGQTDAGEWVTIESSDAQVARLGQASAFQLWQPPNGESVPRTHARQPSVRGVEGRRVRGGDGAGNVAAWLPDAQLLCPQAR